MVETSSIKFRYLALAGNIGLLGWVLLWQLNLSPHPHISNITLAIAWSVPLLLTTLAFVGNTLYARHRGKELGLKLTKLSEVEKQEKARFEE
jgi:uncharacterized membrane protein